MNIRGINSPAGLPLRSLCPLCALHRPAVLDTIVTLRAVTFSAIVSVGLASHNPSAILTFRTTLPNLSRNPYVTPWSPIFSLLEFVSRSVRVSLRSARVSRPRRPPDRRSP